MIRHCSGTFWLFRSRAADKCSELYSIGDNRSSGRQAERAMIAPAGERDVGADAGRIAHRECERGGELRRHPVLVRPNARQPGHGGRSADDATLPPVDGRVLAQILEVAAGEELEFALTQLVLGPLLGLLGAFHDDAEVAVPPFADAGFSLGLLWPLDPASESSS